MRLFLRPKPLRILAYLFVIAGVVGMSSIAMLPSPTWADDDDDDEQWERVYLSGSHQEQQFLAGE